MSATAENISTFPGIPGPEYVELRGVRYRVTGDRIGLNDAGNLSFIGDSNLLIPGKVVTVKVRGMVRKPTFIDEQPPTDKETGLLLPVAEDWEPTGSWLSRVVVIGFAEVSE